MHSVTLNDLSTYITCRSQLEYYFTLILQRVFILYSPNEGLKCISAMEISKAEPCLSDFVAFNVAVDEVPVHGDRVLNSNNPLVPFSLP